MEYRNGFWVFSVRSAPDKEPYEVSIDDATLECWCMCDDYWFKHQPKGIGTLIETDWGCKHIRLALCYVVDPVSDSELTKKPLG